VHGQHEHCMYKGVRTCVPNVFTGARRARPMCLFESAVRVTYLFLGARAREAQLGNVCHSQRKRTPCGW
jgi:hypothetical protein